MGQCDQVFSARSVFELLLYRRQSELTIFQLLIVIRVVYYISTWHFFEIVFFMRSLFFKKTYLIDDNHFP